MEQISLLRAVGSSPVWKKILPVLRLYRFLPAIETFFRLNPLLALLLGGLDDDFFLATYSPEILIIENEENERHITQHHLNVPVQPFIQHIVRSPVCAVLFTELPFYNVSSLPA